MIRKNAVLGFIRKEFIQMFRDVRMRVVLFGPPIIMMLVFGYAINTDVKNVRVGVYDEDKSSESRKFIERFSSSGYFYVVKYFEKEKEVEGYFDKGKIDLYIHIRPNFGRNIKSGKKEEIQIILDGTDSSRASMILASVNNLIQGILMEYVRKNITFSIIKQGFTSPPKLPSNIDVEERIFFNPELSSRNFYLTGMFGLLISMMTVVLTAMSVVKEREAGTIDQIIVSPISPEEFILGKTVPYILVGFIDTFVISLIIILWFKIPFRGSFLLLLLVSLCFLISTTAVGLYISTISTTQQQALLTVILFLLPSLLLSGFAFPIDAMPEVIQWITYANPMRYFIEIMRGIFLKGLGIKTLWPQIILLFATGLILFRFIGKKVAHHLE